MATNSKPKLRPWFHPLAVMKQLIVVHFGIDNASPSHRSTPHFVLI